MRRSTRGEIKAALIVFVPLLAYGAVLIWLAVKG